MNCLPFTGLAITGLPLLAGLTLSWLVVAAPAAAQMETREAISLQNQILELRQELQAAQEQRGVPQPYYAQPAYPSPPVAGGPETAQLVARVGSLEEQVRQLRGRMDELDNSLQRTTADLGKQIDDLKFQLQSPQAGQTAAGPPPRLAPPALPGSPPAGPPPLAAPPVAPPVTRTQAAGPRTPEIALQDGYAAMGRRDYSTAEHDAQEVLSKRASPRAYDAQYLLAQSLAGQHQWSRAAIAYDDTYNRTPKGGHAQEALLGLANSLTAINEKRAACDTLTKLHTEFPRPRTELRDQISAASQRAGCKA